jgi:hypothetical protein
MSEFCLTLLCPPAMEERVLDMLLMTPQISVFTSAPAAAHGLHPSRLDAGEQVLGLAVMTQVQALLGGPERDAVLVELKRKLAGSGLRYWLTPVIESGELA